VVAFELERRKLICLGSLMNRVALVVDDDPAVLELLAEMLEELGCEVLTIAGFELAEQAKRLRPGVKPILVSGRETDGYGYPLLRKPFLQNDLVRVLRETTGLC